MANSPEKEKEAAAAAANAERKKVRTTTLSMISSCGNNSHIPSDVVLENILTRLPVTSLKRFRCVCKLWYSTIVHDRRFHQSHLALSHSHPCLLAFVGTKHKDPHPPVTFNCFFCTSIPSSESNSASFRNLRIQQNYQATEVVNGLVCLYSFESKNYYIYNFSTQEQLKLPLPNSIGSPYYPTHFVLYLGFDHLDKVYKLVKLFYLESQIITLGNKDKNQYCWRRIEYGLSCPIAFAKSVCFNSSLYWIQKKSLIRCDLNEEKFTEIHYPDDFKCMADITDDWSPTMPAPYRRYNDSVQAGLAEIGGRLALTHSYIGAREFFIWMLDDDKKWIWGNKITIDIPIHLHSPTTWFTIPAGRLPAAGTNEILFTIGRSLSSSSFPRPKALVFIPIYSYDLTSRTWKRLFASSSSSPLPEDEMIFKDYSQLYYYHEENILPLKDILSGS